MEKEEETNIHIYMSLKVSEEKYLSSNCVFTESKRKFSNSVMLGAFVPQN